MFSTVGSKRKVDCVVLGEDGQDARTIKVEIGKDPDVVDLEMVLSPIPDSHFKRLSPEAIKTKGPVLTKRVIVKKKKTPVPAPKGPAPQNDWDRLLQQMKELPFAHRVVDRQPVVRSLSYLWPRCSGRSAQEKQGLLRDLVRHYETTQTLGWEWESFVVKVIRETPGGWEFIMDIADKIYKDYFSSLVKRMTEKEVRAQVTSLVPRALVDSKTFCTVTAVVKHSNLPPDDALVVQLRGVDKAVLSPVSMEIPNEMVLLLLHQYMNSDLRFPSDSFKRDVDYKQLVLKSIVEELPVVLRESTRILSEDDVIWLLDNLPENPHVLDAAVTAMIRSSLRFRKGFLGYRSEKYIKLFKAYVARGRMDLIDHIRQEVLRNTNLAEEIKVLIRAWIDAGQIEKLADVPGDIVYRVVAQ